MLYRALKEIGILGLFLFLFLFILGIFSTGIQSHVVLFSSHLPNNFIFSWARSLAMVCIFFIGKSAYFLLFPLIATVLGVLFHRFFLKLALRGLGIILCGAILSGMFSPYPEWLEGGVLGNFLNDFLEGPFLRITFSVLLIGMISYQSFKIIQELVSFLESSLKNWKRFFFHTRFVEKSVSTQPTEQTQTLQIAEKEPVQEVELSVEELLERLEWNSSRLKLSEMYMYFVSSDIFGGLLNRFVKNLYKIQIQGLQKISQDVEENLLSLGNLSEQYGKKENEQLQKVIEIQEYFIHEEKPTHQKILERMIDLTAKSLLEQFGVTDRLKGVFESMGSSFLAPALVGAQNGTEVPFSSVTWSLEMEEKLDSKKAVLLEEDMPQESENIDMELGLLEECRDDINIYKQDSRAERVIKEPIHETYLEERGSYSNNGEDEEIFSKESFHFPSLDLLEESPLLERESEEEKQLMGERILSILSDFNIQAQLSKITVGPVVTRYEIIPPKGLKVNRVIELDDNIALGIASKDRIRIEAPVFGKSVIGIEVPNLVRENVFFRDIAEKFKHRKDYQDFQIPFLVGKTLDGEIYVQDLVKTPHLLIAGSTGSGKSVCVNTLINSILYHRSPSEVRLLLIDPKRVELILYDGLPHLIAPVIKEPAQAIKALKWLVRHMEERYLLLEKEKVRNISEYNQGQKAKGEPSMPYIVTVMDEFADLILLGKREMEESVIRLAAMARAVGIHLVLATQRPSADVITGLIKANFPSRIAFKVSSKMESRIILDENGAENLLGKGDMLFLSSNGGATERIQAPLIGDEEVRRISYFFKDHHSSQYWEEVLEQEETEESASWDSDEDPLFKEALEIVLKERKASASYLQRRLKIGYNRAARLVEMMEEMGIVGRGSGSKPREVLIDEWEY